MLILLAVWAEAQTLISGAWLKNGVGPCFSGGSEFPFGRGSYGTLGFKVPDPLPGDLRVPNPPCLRAWILPGLWTLRPLDLLPLHHPFQSSSPLSDQGPWRRGSLSRSGQVILVWAHPPLTLRRSLSSLLSWKACEFPSPVPGSPLP